MECIENCCRVCLTTEEEGVKFSLVDTITLRKISTIYKFSTPIDQQKTKVPLIICKQCEKDVSTAWNLFNRIEDAGDYFYEKQKNDAGKSNSGKRNLKRTRDVSSSIIYECDACKIAFKDMKSLNEHMASHNGMFF
jgi:protein-arginine kinase activator protein McsA